MKRLAPVSTQWSPCRSARVASEAASDPASGSVRAKAGTVSPRAKDGSQRRFWASVPASRMGWLPSPWIANSASAGGQVRASSSRARQRVTDRNGPSRLPP
jgi:hypothetical protein